MAEIIKQGSIKRLNGSTVEVLHPVTEATLVQTTSGSNVETELSNINDDISEKITNPTTKVSGNFLKYDGTTWVADDIPDTGVLSVEGSGAITATGTEDVTVGIKLDSTGNVTLSQGTNGLKANTTPADIGAYTTSQTDSAISTAIDGLSSTAEIITESSGVLSLSTTVEQSSGEISGGTTTKSVYTSTKTSELIGVETSRAQGIESGLSERIENLESRGRFLSVWNSDTGKPATEPESYPYVYKAGDYFVVGTATAGVTHYKPSGTSRTGSEASTVVETNPVLSGDTYFYDGTSWMLQSNVQKTVSWGNVADKPTDEDTDAGIKVKIDCTKSGDGLVDVTVTGGSVASGNTSVVTGGTVYTALENTKSDISTNYIAKSTLTTKGDIIYASSANTPARLGIGTTGQILKVSSTGLPVWGNESSYTNPWSLTTTVGSEAVSDGTNSLNVVTRDTTQTISGIKTFSDTVTFEENAWFDKGIYGDTTYGLSLYNDGGESSSISLLSNKARISASEIELEVSGGSGSGVVTVPHKSGELALVSDITSHAGIDKVGTVTSITAGAGLTGGTITTSGTVALATSGVSAGTYSAVTVDTYGRVTSGGQILDVIANGGTPNVIDGGWYFECNA